MLAKVIVSVRDKRDDVEVTRVTVGRKKILTYMDYKGIKVTNTDNMRKCAVEVAKNIYASSFNMGLNRAESGFNYVIVK